MIKKILIYFFIFVLMFLFFDIALYSILYSKYRNEQLRPRVVDYFKSYKIRNFDDYCKCIENGEGFRDVINQDKKNDKKPIFLFGCSFAHGALLNDNQTFAYKLSNMTGRDVYNLSVAGGGIQYVLYILEKTDIEKYLPEPEYIIYIFIDNHIFRLYEYFYMDLTPDKAVRYKIKDNKLIYDDHYNILYHFAFFRYLTHHLADIKYNSKDFNTNFDLMIKYFKAIKETASKKFPNSKLVIIKYEENKNSNIYNSPKWKELEDIGYIIIDSYNLTGGNNGGVHLNDTEYRILNDVHPNEKEWDILTPKVVEALKL